MITDIIDFLPIYPDKTDALFTTDIYKKREFYENRPVLYEKNQESKEPVLLKGQIIISRFLSSHTPYDQLLIDWQMGVGKTCASVAAIEQIRKENSTFTEALIFVSGDTLIENYKEEIINCTGEKYLPENYNDLTPGQQVARKNKLIGRYYTFNTFETFAANIINTSSDENIIETYSNKIIIVDEVHNIRIQDIKNKKKKEVLGLKPHVSIYNNFHRFLHLVKNCKIILMSGTPIKDSVDEIASVMNLILPLDEQLPNKKDFIKEFYTKEGVLIPGKAIDLKKKFKGRISYLESSPSAVVKDFVGEKMGTLKYFKVFPITMSALQTEGYTNAYGKDRVQKEKKADEEEYVEYYEEEEETYEDGAGTVNKSGKFDLNSRQASIFVFPDGTYGSEGFNKNIKKTRGILSKKYNYSLGPALLTVLGGASKNYPEKIEKLRLYSDKFALVIENILRSYTEGKSSFVYCEWVEGSGGILFSLILSLFGFQRYTGNEDLKKELDERPRFAIINTNTITYKNQITNIKQRFNNPNNMHGKIISFIIGSTVVAEGVSFKNIQVEHILTPHWNYSETEQAIARGYRFGSHDALINAGITPEFKIYQYVSIPAVENGINISVDLRMYEMSENKDIKIKGITQLIKESAFDCPLNYRRNHVTGYDLQRECNYTNCDYKCDDFNMSLLETKPILDESSYRVYYTHDNVKKIIDSLQNIYKTRFILGIDQIQELLPKNTFFDILTSLRQMINNNVIIHNKYGIESYLREENNIFFLVDSITPETNYFSNYYNQIPILNLEKSFVKIIDSIYDDELPLTIERLFESETEGEIQNILELLSIEVKESILEYCILARELCIEKSQFQRDTIIRYYDDSFQKLDNTWISTLLYLDKNIYRCFDVDDIAKGIPITSLWKDCSDEYISVYKERRKNIIATLKRDYPYIGTYNDEKFCIIKSNFSDDKRRENKGKVCSTWKQPILVHLLLNVLRVPVDPSKYPNVWNDVVKTSRKGREALIAAVRGRKKNIKICTNSGGVNWETEDYTYDDLEDNFSDEDLLQMLYYGSLKIPQLCETIKEYFRQNDILEFDERCGTSKK